MADVCISNLSWTGPGKNFLLLLGLGLPIALLWKKLGRSPEEADDILREASPILPFAWVGLFLTAFLLRFYHLTSLSGWPLTDEAWENFFALNLMKQWKGDLLYCVTELPPGYFWLQSLCFKVLGVSLTTLWLLPALLSLAVFLLFAVTLRQIFSEIFAFLAASLMGLLYWPLVVGRTSEAGGLALAWECLCGFLLVQTLKKKGPGWFGILGVAVGAGFYTYHVWWPAALLFGCIVLAAQIPGIHKFGRRASLVRLALYAFGFFATAAPFWWALAVHGISGFLSSLFLFHDKSTFLNGWTGSLSYFLVLFWGKDWAGGVQSPWYDFLGPLETAGFFTGTVLILRSRHSPWSWLLLGSIPLLTSPGWLSVTVDPFRMIGAMPPIFLVSAAGLLWILKGWKGTPLWKPLAVFLLITVLYHGSFLWGTYRHDWSDPNSQPCRDHKSVEAWRAFESLKGKAQKEGPGILMTDLEMFPFDQSLGLAAYSFDWLRNPALDRRQPGWMALLINPQAVPLVQKHCPQATATWLSEGLNRPYGGLSLVVLSTQELKPDQLGRWMAADQAFRQMTLKMIYQTQRRGGEEVLADLQQYYPLVAGDPFLECVFWQKSVFNHVMVGDMEGALKAAQMGVTASGPNAFFYDQMGQIYWKKKDRRRALEAFRKATECPVDLTPAAQRWKVLSLSNER